MELCRRAGTHPRPDSRFGRVELQLYLVGVLEARTDLPSRIPCTRAAQSHVRARPWGRHSGMTAASRR